VGPLTIANLTAETRKRKDNYMLDFISCKANKSQKESLEYMEKKYLDNATRYA
jgi:hypothetical protein